MISGIDESDDDDTDTDCEIDIESDDEECDLEPLILTEIDIESDDEDLESDALDSEMLFGVPSHCTSSYKTNPSSERPVRSSRFILSTKHITS